MSRAEADAQFDALFGGGESVADRAERLAARHTRYDGSPQ